MSKTIRRGMQGYAGLIGGLGALLVQMSAASAAAPVTLKLAAGVGGPFNYEDPQEGIENGGAGNEQAVTGIIEKGGKTYVVVVAMNSDVPEELRPNQGKCSSFELTPQGPVLVADQVYLTENENTDRPFNKPGLQRIGENLMLGYGYAPNNGNTRSYVRLINEMCQSISDTVQISNNNNNNIGAVHMTEVAGKVVANFYNNNQRTTSFRVLSVEGNTIQKSEAQVMLNPSNIGRTPLATSGQYALGCTGLGNNRPPEYGIGCTMIDGATGEIMFKNEIIAASDPENNLYFNQAQVVELGPGRFAVLGQESNGEGKNSNDKGSNLDHLWILEPTASSPNIKAHSMGNAIYATHSTLIVGGVGETGERTVGIFEASPTGSGPASVQFMRYDSQSLSFKPADQINDLWIASTLSADSAQIPNLYGNNPQTQGRNYFHGVGDIKNPGFGVPGGFMEDAETLFVLPYSGRASDMMNEPKLALYVTMLPGKTAKPVPPSNPTETPPEQFKPESVQPGAPQGSGNGGPAAPGFTPTPSTDDAPAAKTEAAGACAFSAEGVANSAGGFALGLALLGLAASRRRKES